MQEKGFQLSGIHPKIDIAVDVDNKNYDYEHRSNFLVEKKGRSGLVKLKKSGSTSVLPPDLRQELVLEYLFYSPDEIFIYDAEKNRIHEVTISVKGSGINKEKSRFILVVLIILGCALLGRFVFGEVFIP